MKKTKIIYWIFTGLLCLGMLFSAIPAITHSKHSIDFITALGYPAYFIPFNGWSKLFGVIGILIPGFPRIREWAYAGLTFDLIGATYSLLASGAPLVTCAFMAIWFIVLFGSYIYYHRMLKSEAQVAVAN